VHYTALSEPIKPLAETEFTMISIENLSKSFGGQVIFDRATFRINARERVGLVGRNGHGKTTLFRIITGLESNDEGILHIPKNYQIGYVEQHLHFTKDTILDEGMTQLPPAEADQAWKVEKILTGLGFSMADMQRRPDAFSGGYQVRLNLAKVLVAEPNLLLLDEPTNYLDITSIRWLERFLATWPGELMLITHDRSFMDKVVTHTLGIHRRKMRKLAGNTEKYYAQIAQDEEIYEKTRINDEKRRKEIELFISRFRAKARLANMVQSRVKTLSKMEKHEKLEAAKNLDFSFRHKPFPAKQILRVEGLGFGYSPEECLICDLDLTVGAGQRICVIGKNGRGKTTLLKLLEGKLSPNKGVLSYHPAATTGFYEQTNVSSLVTSRTVEEEILYTDAGVERQLARNICGAMMFEGDAALKKIGVLSGGEKSRVMLGKLLAQPSNVLLLDEPSNHLDMESCDALLSALDNFPGAIIMVTHNEMFLHLLAEKLIIFQDDKVTVFDGTYSEFLEKIGWREENGPEKRVVQEARNTPESVKLTKKEARKVRSDILTEKNRVIRPIEKKMAVTEKEIERQENRLEGLNQSMLTASQAGDGTKISELSKKINVCQRDIDRLFEVLDELMSSLEKKSVSFDRQLEALNTEAE
jgi:ATP-binding cassette subfamily F protein 3